MRARARTIIHSETREGGQTLVIVGVWLSLALLFGLLLVINLAYVLLAYQALQQALDLAAASGVATLQDVPGGPAQDVEAQVALVLERNVAALPYAEGRRTRVFVVEPAGGACEPDPHDPDRCYRVPFVSVGLTVKVQMLWGGLVTFRLHGLALAAEAPR